MNEIKLIISYKQASLNELDEQANRLIIHAKNAAIQAHAPYSLFRVGAALLLSDGEIITGANQENAAYPSGLCAERVALFKFGFDRRDRHLVKAAIAVPQIKGEDLIPPCGACLQVFAEYRSMQSTPIEILLVNGSDKVLLAPDIYTFLPLAFTKKSLNFSP